jgi:hypothetical protein
MIGYIVVRHYHYDPTEPVSDPSVVYFNQAEAAALAAQQTGNGCTGYVWEVEIPTLRELPDRTDGWKLETEESGQVALVPA